MASYNEPIASNSFLVFAQKWMVILDCTEIEAPRRISFYINKIACVLETDYIKREKKID